jgi:hypothetical protein
MKNYASAGAQGLPPLIETATDAPGITGETEKVETSGEALARAYMAGINIVLGRTRPCYPARLDGCLPRAARPS